MGHESKARAMGLVTPGGQPASTVNFTGPVIDRFGNPITDGCRVIYRSPIDLVYLVESLTPVMLHPRQIQQGARPMVRMRVSCEFDIPVGVGQPQVNLIVIGQPLTPEQEAEMKRQRDAAAAATNGQPAGDADPSGEPPAGSGQPPEGGSSDEPPTTG